MDDISEVIQPHNKKIQRYNVILWIFLLFSVTVKRYLKCKFYWLGIDVPHRAFYLIRKTRKHLYFHFYALHISV